MSLAPQGSDAFTWRWSQYQYFWKHKAAIGFGNAVAVARRAHLRIPPPPSTVGTRISPLSGYLCRHPLPPSPSLSHISPPLHLVYV